mgnify:CR=1 FL=1
MSHPLEGRVALVTGGAVRIGAEICATLAAAGAIVAVHCHRSLAAAEDLVEAIDEAGGEAFGRFVNTASPSGIYGNIGQSNYGAAKGAIVSLTWALAFELRNHGITVNAIAPMGATRAFGDTTYREMLSLLHL